MKYTLKGARLSTNPDTKVVPNANGVNGQANETVNGNQFYVCDYKYMKGPRIETAKVLIWANDKVFDTPAAEYNEAKGLVVEGQPTRFGREEGLTPYEIDGKFVDNVTLHIFEGENPQTVFAAWQKNQLNRGTNAIVKSVADTKSPEELFDALEEKLGKATTPTRKAKIQKEIDELVALHPELG